MRVNVTGIAVAGTLGTSGGAGFLVPPPNMTPFSATSSCPLGNLITVADSDICFLLGGYVDWRKSRGRVRMSDQRLRSRSFFGGFKVTKCGYSFVHICLYAGGISSTIYIVCSVPRGSVLSPLLFMGARSA